MRRKYYLNALIVVLIMSLFRFLPPFGNMTPLGMAIMGIFLGALWGWITCDMIWPSALALIMLGFTDYAQNVSAVLTTAVSNGTVQLILWLLTFSAMLTTTGVSKWLVAKLTGSRFCNGHPWRLSFVICFAVWVCAALGAGFAAILICWQFIYSICSQVGYSNKDKWPKLMICAIIFFNALGGLALPYKGGVVAYFGFLNTASGGAYPSYSYIQYLIFSLVFSVCVMAVYFLMVRVLLRPDVSRLAGKIEMAKAEALNLRQKMALVAVVALFVLTILPSCLPTGAVTAFVNRLGTAASVLFLIALFTFIRDKEGKPYFTFKELANQGIAWPLLFMVATATTMGGALSAEESGFTATMVSLFAPILENTSPFACAAFIVIAALALTNVINNTVAAAIMVPVMYPFANQMGINPLMMTALICFTTNCGLLLPSASPGAAMLYGNKEWVRTKDGELYSLVAVLAVALVAICVGIPFGNFIFHV